MSAATSRVRLRTPVAAVVVVGAMVALSGCDRLQAALKDDAELDTGDPVWKADSTLLASSPGILFRIVEGEPGRLAVPFSTIGAQGFRRIRMGPRGWRALDLQYLHAGSSIRAVRNGRVLGAVNMVRGMWDAGTQLDSIPRCNIKPVGLTAGLSTDIQLAIAGPTPKTNPVAALSAGELQQAMSTIPTLIAPSNGIGTSALSQYTREVHVINSGIGTHPTIVVIYNDPEVLPDSLATAIQRPRYFMVILDKGIYGYKTTFTYTTIGNPSGKERLRFLDYVDVDQDGVAELFFSYTFRSNRGNYSMTKVLRYESDMWKEVMFAPDRCQ